LFFFISLPIMWIEIFVFFVVLYILSQVYRLFNAQEIKGQIILITGGGSGLGRRLALSFSKLGAKIVIIDINEEGINKVVKEVKEQGGEAWGYRCNVSSYQDVIQVANSVKLDVGKVDILINNAGIVSGKFITDLTEEHIVRTFNVNTVSHFWTLKEFLPDMLKTNKGHIVTISSAAGINATTGLVDYSASKFGAFGTNEALRLDLKKRKITGVHTTVICPFYINTGMFAGVKTKFPLLLPILDEGYVTERIVDAVKHKDYILVLPAIVRLSWLGRFIFPVSVGDYLLEFLGVTDAMDEFKGRGWQVTDPNKKTA